MFLICGVMFCMLLGSSLKHASSYSYENITQLKAALLTGYDPDVIPLNNQTDTLNVTVGMTLYQLLEVDTVRGVMWTTLSLQCSWLDEKIKWTPSDYGGINSVMIQSKYVWTPPLTLGQPVEVEKFGESWMHVTYQSNGLAFWNPGGVNELTCSMDMKYWPFDEQICDISYYPFDYWNGQIRFIVTGIITNFFNENGEWTLEKTEASTRNIYGVEEALFKITLRRRPAFYILTLLLPLCGLGFLVSFVFLLPSESGERVSYAITILLALTVFLTIISDNIPKTSNPVPLLCIFLIINVLMSSLTTFIIILNLRIYHRNSDKKIGRWYTMLFRVTGCRSNKESETTIVEAFKNVDISGRDNTDKHGKLFHVTCKQATNTNDKMMSADEELYLNEQDGYNVYITWKDVSNAIDNLMFVSLTISNVILTIVSMSLLFIK